MSILEISGRGEDDVKTFEWSFDDLMPDLAFCNWQFKVKGFKPFDTSTDE